MDRSRVLERAHLYYAIAIFDIVKSNSREFSIYDITCRYSGGDPDNGYFELLSNDVVFSNALSWLYKNKLITLLTDDFGPALIQRGEECQEIFGNLATDKSLPFYPYIRVSDSNSWITSAIRSLNESISEFNITDEEFNNPDTSWLPISLNQDDQRLIQTIEDIKSTIDGVRASNEYAASIPTERNYVLTSLKLGATELETEKTTSAPFIRKYILESLNMLGDRFRKDAIGLLAQAAIASLKAWLTQYNIHL